MGMLTKPSFVISCDCCGECAFYSVMDGTDGYFPEEAEARQAAVAAGFEEEVVDANSKPGPTFSAAASAARAAVFRVDGESRWLCQGCKQTSAPIPATVDKAAHDELLKAAGDVVLMLDFGMPLFTVQMRLPHWDKIYALREAVEKAKGGAT